eukprot:477771-Pelagomonas_calceolata.AAC.2
MYTPTHTGRRPLQCNLASQSAYAGAGPHTRTGAAGGIHMPPCAEANRSAHRLHLWGRAQGATGAREAPLALFKEFPSKRSGCRHDWN